VRSYRILMVLAIVAVGGVTAACRVAPQPMPTFTRSATPTLVPTAVATPEPATVNGTSCPDAFEEARIVTHQVDLTARQVMTLSLGSNPSIPCSWQVPEISDPGVLRQTDHERIWPAEGVTPMPGAPGTEVWVFEATAAGNAEVAIVCTCLDEQGAEQVVEGRLVVDATVE